MSRALLPILEVATDDGYGFTEWTLSPDTVLLLSLPCPANGKGSGVGGQVITSCSFCGEIMASTAGPHSSYRRYYKPVVVVGCNDGVVEWRPFFSEDGRVLV